MIPGWASSSDDSNRLHRLRVLGGTSGPALLQLITDSKGDIFTTAISSEFRRLIAAAMPKGDPGEVTIVQFSDDGKKLQQVRVPKVVKSEDEWRKQLSEGEFDITRHADTEIAFSGKYWNLHDKGFYRCICCDTAKPSSRLTERFAVKSIRN